MESVTEAMRSASVNHTTHERSSFVVVCFRSSSVESTQHRLCHLSFVQLFRFTFHLSVESMESVTEA
ncbi:hypothetical protein HanHA300_Chr16g0621691 [Helianthus annuus]|nr:hypothetical protein HanHA300_Chr16g0621691 [Helianthus annuus]KAJ0461466.1 hypothetical protein HanHA89_Chr16g0672591 [Helianthus annuus]KAJ0645761.1 hypothetical protein HanOQP8_Chr16g0627531 [Helianthus annuus]